MEILHKFKQNGYFTADLYHLLAKKKLADPSQEVRRKSISSVDSLLGTEKSCNQAVTATSYCSL